jgi:hypothetical protein
MKSDYHEHESERRMCFAKKGTKPLLGSSNVVFALVADISSLLGFYDKFSSPCD